jgi:hypothetical protein
MQALSERVHEAASKREETKEMRYQIRVAGKIFEGSDPRVLLKRAVEAKREKAPSKPDVRSVIRPPECRRKLTLVKAIQAGHNTVSI